MGECLVSQHALQDFPSALYLERHNFEIVPTNTCDGGVFVVSTRTCRHFWKLEFLKSLHQSLERHTLVMDLQISSMGESFPSHRTLLHIVCRIFHVSST